MLLVVVACWELLRPFPRSLTLAIAFAGRRRCSKQPITKLVKNTTPTDKINVIRNEYDSGKTRKIYSVTRVILEFE